MPPGPGNRHPMPNNFQGMPPGPPGHHGPPQPHPGMGMNFANQPFPPNMPPQGPGMSMMFLLLCHFVLMIC